MLILFYFTLCYAGTIWPGFISNTIANRNQYSDYTIQVIPETNVPAGGYIEIVFPIQYQSGLGNKAYCTNCTINGHTISFYFTDTPILSVANTLNIYNILNPAERGGTGNFIIRTKRFEFIYDENLIFQTIGIADDIAQLSSCIVSFVDPPISGSLGKYNFAFKTNINLPLGTTIQLFIPNVFIISDNPSCSLYSINDLVIEGNIVCKLLEGSRVQVSGFSNDIIAGSEVGIQISLTNPSYSQVTSTFTIAAYRQGTSIIYTWKTGINGIQILPGLIKDITLLPMQKVRLATQKIVDYQLKFLPTNSLSKGSAIMIKFPNTFKLDGSQVYLFFKSGLEDISETSPLQMQKASDDILITNYKETLPNQIIIQFRAKNPSTAGPSSALDIRTCTDSTCANIIDQNKVDAFIQVEAVASLDFIDVTLNQPTSQQTSTNLQFRITPTFVIPGGAYIKVLLDSAFYVGTVSAANCLSISSPITVSLMCNKSDNLITWQNPFSVQYNVNLLSSFSIVNLVQTPTYAGIYTVDIEIFNSQGSLLQSYTNYIEVKPLELASPTLEFVGPEESIIGTPNKPRYSILITTFYNQIIIPEGGYDPTKQKAQGRIKFQFPTNSLYLNNFLGTAYKDGDQIPCKAVKGLLPMENLKIQCNIYELSDPVKGAYIIMRNFKEIPYRSNIEIHIPNIQNPAFASAEFTITILQKQFGVDTELNIFKKSQTFRTQFNLNPGVSVSQMQISNTKLSGVFNVSMDIVPGNDFDDGTDFIVKLPGYDTMFIPDQEIVVCYIDTYLTPCITYPGVDWILMRIKAPQVHYYTAPIKPRLHIYNLRWPRYSDSVGWVSWTMLKDPFSSGMNYEVEARTLYYNGGTDKFLAPDINDFDEAQILSPKKGKGFVGLNYEFYFKTKYLIPDGSEFILTFPTDFSLDGSYPQPQFQAPQFYSQSDSKPLLFVVSGNVLRVKNIREHPASGPFRIIVQGVKSSKQPSIPQAKPFLAELQVGGKSIVKTQDAINGFDYFDYGTEFVPGKVIFNSITAFPSNQLEYAKYEFTFILTNELLAGGEISITFPKEFYPKLPIPQIDCICNVTGALTSFKSCKLWDYTYIMITDERYQSGEITFQINNVLNPLSGNAGLFTITSKYDGTFLDISDDTLQSVRQLFISPKSEPVLVQSIDFAPRNEGEEATYTFQFVPSTYIDSAFIVLEFPQNYDTRLGNVIICKPYDCIAQNRQIWVSGITNYQPLGTNPIIVIVQGIINPNQNINDQWTGYFGIGVIKQNTFNYIDYNSKAGRLQVVQAPGWSYLYNVLPQNLFSRWSNTSYMFNMTALLNVPKESSQGSIIIDFPKQFDIPDGSKRCAVYKSTFAQKLTCTSLTNSITIQGNTEDKNGIITFNVTEIANPSDEVTIDQILVKTYDGFKKQIIEKSYKNLDPWTFTYKFPGPLITINDDSVITVERGTQTKDLWFKVAYPCALDLIFTPISELTIIPNKIKLSLTDLQQKFRVSASQTLQPGTYYITWKVSGELSDIPYYTPVKKSTVKVTNNKNIRVNVPTLNEVPIGGNSLDTYVSVDYAPDLGFEILLTSLSTALTLDKRSMQFVAGQNNATFRVSCNKTEYQKVSSNNLQISLTLSGINRDVYLLTQTLIDITIIQEDSEPPFITGLLNDQTSQTQTNIIFSVGEIAVVYYMIALQGTQQPSNKQLLDLGPALYNTTQSQFGKVSIGKTNTATVRIRNLRAQTNYVVYAIAEDRSSLFSDIKSLKFNTTNRYNASSVTLTFKQSYLNQAERQNIMKKIAFVLSLPTTKVIEKTSYTTQRILQSVSIGLSIYLISIPTTENFPSPYNMVTILNSRLIQLSKLVSNLDTTTKLEAQDFSPVYPSFMTKPSQVSSDFTTCTVQGTLDMVGALFVISVQAAQDTASPLAQQVWWGYNSQNLAMPANWTQVTIPNQIYQIVIQDLTEDTDYNIYMIAGSAHPGYPDLSTDEKAVNLVSCRTKAQQPDTILDINWAKLLIMNILVIIIF
ncbi:unnamed protein product [Paramecium pentaurelia]|uniref:Uncharacterized protein n=1 Tax=Paramecium pentaurelia TaxID=43138 RepID=A0A8S1VAJ0_9CILI|nr:unnamed protein product [Paramecium pentaurelia]